MSVQVLIASGRDAGETERARNAVRAQIAFYASTPAYRGVLDSCGRGALHPELHALSRGGDWRAMAALVDDELLEAVAVCAPPETPRRTARRTVCGVRGSREPGGAVAARRWGLGGGRARAAGEASLTGR